MFNNNNKFILIVDNVSVLQLTSDLWGLFISLKICPGLMIFNSILSVAYQNRILIL